MEIAEEAHRELPRVLCEIVAAYADPSVMDFVAEYERVPDSI
jgi:hypothetical protein